MPLTIASGIVGALKDNPIVLALLVMNLGLMFIVWLLLDKSISQQAEIHALLSKCVDADVLKSLGLLPK